MFALILALALVVGLTLALDTVRSERRESAAFQAWAMPTPAPMGWTPRALAPRAVPIDPSAGWLHARPAPRHRLEAPAN